MPLVRHTWEGEQPIGGHLAYLADPNGLFVALVPGTQMLLIEDTNRADKIFPVVLAKVSRRKLIFHCACKDPRCTRTYSFECKASGWHHQQQRNTAHEAEPDAPSAPSPETE